MLVREGLASLLADAGIEVCARVIDGPALLEAVQEHHPDLAIIDVRLPPDHSDEGARAAVTLRARHPELGIMLLSQHVETDIAARLVGSGPGGFGYLLKDRVLRVEDFLDAIERVASGGTAIDRELVADLIHERHDRSGMSELTGRERDVLELIVQGRSNAAIARTLFLTPKTVESYIHSIYSKLSLAPAPDDHRRVLAVLTYLRAT